MAGEIIRPTALPDRPSPVASEKLPVDNGSNVGGATIKSIVEAGRPAASQLEAETGTDPSKAMTPLTTAQAMEARVPGIVGPIIDLLGLGDLATKDTVNNADWSGADLTIENGGTGASTPEAARTALNVPSVAEAQAFAQAIVPIYEAATGIAATNVPASVSAFRTNGYYEAGDGGAALYKYAATEPTHAGKLLSADGRWWELAELLPNVRQFGARGDSATDDTGAFQDAIQYGDAVFIQAGDYLVSATLTLPDGFEMVGVGGGYFFNHKSKLLFTGTGAKSYSMPGATATVIANPSVGEAYLGDSGTRGDNYSTLDLTAPFSAAVILGKGSKLSGLGIYPNFNGVAGYAGSDGALSDEWDVGVWCRNSDGWSLDKVIVAGHWRKAAGLVSAHDVGDGNVPSNELGHAVNCVFQGFRGLALRCPETVVGANYGFAGTDFINCTFRPLNHQSAHLATSSFLTTPFPSPSACLELSGGVVRGVQFINSTLIGRDDICAIFGKTAEILFSGCYEEAKSIKVGGDWLDPTLGSRMVATANTVGLKFIENSKYGVDFSPGQTRDSSLSGQRYTATGVFNPGTSYDDDYSVRLFGSYVGYRLRKSNDRYIFSDANDAAVVEVNEVGLAAKILYSGVTALVADDGVVSVPLPRNGGMCAIMNVGASSNHALPSVSHSGIVAYDGGTSLSLVKLAGSATFAGTAGDVIGTTGADGSVTVGIIAGNLRIENRSGGPSMFRYSFFG